MAVMEWPASLFSVAAEMMDDEAAEIRMAAAKRKG